MDVTILPNDKNTRYKRKVHVYFTNDKKKHLKKLMDFIKTDEISLNILHVDGIKKLTHKMTLNNIKRCSSIKINNYKELINKKNKKY